MVLQIELDTTGIDAKGLIEMIEAETQKVNDALAAMQENPDEINIADMFSMQLLMNHTAQQSEMATSIVSASNTAINSMARNIK